MEYKKNSLPAGEMGGIIGKKLGLGKALARPVIRQNDMAY